jgi:mono/diheme cytochrome c family protein
MGRFRLVSPNRWVLLLAAEVAVGAAIVYFLFIGPGRPGGGQDAGKPLYAENCAKCHGANLEGQPDWMQRLPSGRLPAPPHDATGHTWHHADEQLFAITKFGLQAIAPGYESDMPAFEGILSDDEIRSILSYIKSTWPERERAYQAARSSQAL